MIPNNSAGNETYNRKKFIHARPCSGRALGLAAGEADGDQAEIGQRQIENVDHGESVLLILAPIDTWTDLAAAKVNSHLCL
jgi:hypothetical protein